MPKQGLKWRVGWRVTGAAKSTPTYAPGEYESFADADYVRREMQRSFPGNHFFVDTFLKGDASMEIPRTTTGDQNGKHK